MHERFHDWFQIAKTIVNWLSKTNDFFANIFPIPTSADPVPGNPDHIRSTIPNQYKFKITEFQPTAALSITRESESIICPSHGHLHSKYFIMANTKFIWIDRHKEVVNWLSKAGYYFLTYNPIPTSADTVPVSFIQYQISIARG